MTSNTTTPERPQAGYRGRHGDLPLSERILNPYLITGGNPAILSETPLVLEKIKAGILDELPEVRKPDWREKGSVTRVRPNGHLGRNARVKHKGRREPMEIVADDDAELD